MPKRKDMTADELEDFLAELQESAERDDAEEAKSVPARTPGSLAEVIAHAEAQAPIVYKTIAGMRFGLKRFTDGCEWDKAMDKVRAAREHAQKLKAAGGYLVNPKEEDPARRLYVDSPDIVAHATLLSYVLVEPKPESFAELLMMSKRAGRIFLALANAAYSINGEEMIDAAKKD